MTGCPSLGGVAAASEEDAVGDVPRSGRPPRTTALAELPSASIASAPGRARGVSVDAPLTAGPAKPAAVRDPALFFTGNSVDQSWSAQVCKIGMKMLFSCEASKRRAATWVGPEWSRARASDLSVMTLLSHPREAIFLGRKVFRTPVVSTRNAHTVWRIVSAVPSWLAAVPSGGMEPMSERCGDSQHGQNRERSANMR